MAKKTRLQKKKNYKQKSRTRVKKTRVKRAGKKRVSRKLYGGAEYEKAFMQEYEYLLKDIKDKRHTNQSFEDYVIQNYFIHNYFLDAEIDILIDIGTLLKKQKLKLPQIFEYQKRIFFDEEASKNMKNEEITKKKGFQFLLNAELVYYELLSVEERNEIIRAFKDSEFYSDNTEIIETLISTDADDNKEIFMIFLKRLIDSKSESDFDEILVNVLGVIKEIKDTYKDTNKDTNKDTYKDKKSCLEIYYEYLNSFCANFKDYTDMINDRKQTTTEIDNDFKIILPYMHKMTSIHNLRSSSYYPNNYIKLKLFISSYYLSLLYEQNNLFINIYESPPEGKNSNSNSYHKEQNKGYIQTVQSLHDNLKEKINIPKDYEAYKDLRIIDPVFNKFNCYSHIKDIYDIMIYNVPFIIENRLIKEQEQEQKEKQQRRLKKKKELEQLRKLKMLMAKYGNQ